MKLCTSRSAFQRGWIQVSEADDVIGAASESDAPPGPASVAATEVVFRPYTAVKFHGRLSAQHRRREHIGRSHDKVRGGLHAGLNLRRRERKLRSFRIGGGRCMVECAFEPTIRDLRAPRQSCRTDLATRSSRRLRPPRHHQAKRAAEAPRLRRLNELTADLTKKHLAPSCPDRRTPLILSLRREMSAPEATQQARCAALGFVSGVGTARMEVLTAT